MVSVGSLISLLLCNNANRATGTSSTRHDTARSAARTAATASSTLVGLGFPLFSFHFP